jgi:hypothetical protein
MVTNRPIRTFLGKAIFPLWETTSQLEHRRRWLIRYSTEYGVLLHSYFAPLRSISHIQVYGVFSFSILRSPLHLIFTSFALIPESRFYHRICFAFGHGPLTHFKGHRGHHSLRSCSSICARSWISCPGASLYEEPQSNRRLFTFAKLS